MVIGRWSSVIGAPPLVTGLVLGRSSDPRRRFGHWPLLCTLVIGLFVGRSSLVLHPWSLVVGHWSLVGCCSIIGHSLAGHWLPVAAGWLVVCWLVVCWLVVCSLFAGCSLVGCWSVGCWSLVVGRCFPDLGLWSLAFGYRSFVIGHWSFVVHLSGCWFRRRCRFSIVRWMSLVLEVDGGYWTLKSDQGEFHLMTDGQ